MYITGLRRQNYPREPSERVVEEYTVWEANKGIPAYGVPLIRESFVVELKTLFL